MDKIKDLTEGSISEVIRKLAAPLIGASFIQMAYTLTDMFWLGKLGSGPVAAVGAAFFFTWLNTALSYTPKIGTEITVSQSLGSQDKRKAIQFATTGINICFYMSVVIGIFLFLAAPFLLQIFRLEDSILQTSVNYLRWVVPSLIASFHINTYSAVYYGSGNSKLPFRLISIGLILNIILDPLFIFGIGIFPGLQTQGAAIATTLAQIIVMMLFAKRLYSYQSPLGPLKVFISLQKKYVYPILKLGVPVSLQSGLFSIIGMTIGSLASRFGHIAVAAQSLGSQIEAISWMTASGFSTALSSFVGQNYGAKKYERIIKGYKITLLMAGLIGITAGICFIAFPGAIYGVFISEPDARSVGADYLRIMGYSQIFMVLELVTTGGFNGVGKTHIPAVTGIVLNALRIPLALLLIHTTLELTGIWWAITISSTLKGLLLFIWFYIDVLRPINIMCNLRPIIKDNR